MIQVEQQIKDVMEIGKLGETFVPRSVVLGYNLIPTASLSGAAKRVAFKMNSLMDLYYFSTVVLGKNRFSRNPDKARNLHYQMCLTVMKDGLKEGIEIPRDHFKALSLETKIPTPTGFKKICDIHVGDYVFGEDGKPVEVIGESPVENSNDCYVVTFSTGDEILCDAGHLWTVDDTVRLANETYYHGDSVLTTEEMASSYIKAERKDSSTGKIHYEHRYRIAVAAPVQYAEKTLPIHPYALGCWLGDGTSANASFTCADSDIISVLREVGIKVTIQAAKYRYGFVGKFCTELNKLGVTNDKHIPSLYLQGSEEQRWDLLCGLMDTDGSVSKEGQCSFTNTNLELMEHVRTLIASLGMKPSIISQYQSYVGKKEVAELKKTAYIVTFYPNNRVPFYLPRKQDRCRDRKRDDYRFITRIDKYPSVPVKCISVASKKQLYLAGEAYVPTHNSTVYSECFPMWRALPFSKREEDLFSNLGYSDLYIKWLRRAHRRDLRVLIVSETIKNAIKLGVRISNHYMNTVLFRELFPEILPTEKETWTNESLHHRRTPEGRGQGEGTYDFIGVGAALQSRHYDLVIQDDLVGREARKSTLVMADTIDYHQILVGATDNDPDNPGKDFDEIVVGNRWSHDDLNSYIRKEEDYFHWTTHGALGGCCSLHPFGQPIFPEAFTREKLLRWKKRLGSYHFSCQFLNYPIDPSKARINVGDFRYFNFEKITGAVSIPKELPYRIFETQSPQQFRTVIRHHVADGDVEPDVFPRNIDRAMIVDPNHGGSHLGQEVGKNGRCRHAIVAIGWTPEPRRVYVLDQWAKACSIDEFVGKVFFCAVKWKLRAIHVEAVASQKYLTYHLNYFIQQHLKTRPELSGIRIVELKTSNIAGAKQERIENFIPLIERHEIWLDANNCSDIKEEAENYGQRKGLIDLLDVLSYSTQITKFEKISKPEVDSFMAKQRAQFVRRMAAAAS